MRTRSSGLATHAGLGAAGVVLGALVAVLWQGNRSPPAEVWFLRMSPELRALEVPDWSKVRRSPSGPTVTSFRRGLPGGSAYVGAANHLERHADALWFALRQLHDFRSTALFSELTTETSTVDGQVWHRGSVFFVGR